MSSTPPEVPMEYAQAVHRLAQMVPVGRVLSYGDVAELLGSGGARQVGKAMGFAPEGTAWWRIIRSDGSLTAALAARAEATWAAEELATPGRRVAINRHRWHPNDAAWKQIDELRLALGNPKLSEADDQL